MCTLLRVVMSTSGQNLFRWNQARLDRQSIDVIFACWFDVSPERDHGCDNFFCCHLRLDSGENYVRFHTPFLWGWTVSTHARMFRWVQQGRRSLWVNWVSSNERWKAHRESPGNRRVKSMNHQIAVLWSHLHHLFSTYRLLYELHNVVLED